MINKFTNYFHCSAVSNTHNGEFLHKINWHVFRRSRCSHSGTFILISSSFTKWSINLLFIIFELLLLQLIGLDNAGKTSILYKLKLDELLTTVPTIGFNVETIKIGKINFTLWDIGGAYGCDSLNRFLCANKLYIFRTR